MNVDAKTSYMTQKVKDYYHRFNGKEAFEIARAFIEGLSYSESKPLIEVLNEENERLLGVVLEAEYDYNNM